MADPRALTTAVRTVLLVEDTEDDAELARAAFSRTGIRHELLLASDAREALELLGSERRLDVALLDLKLPGIDGIELLRRIRGIEHRRTLPVVVLTSSIEERDVEHSYDAGANSYLRKPVDFAEFVELATRLLTYWLELNQPPRALSPEG